MRGKGTHGWGARKKHQGSGHRGGFGMAGTGKRADQKKSLVIHLYGNNYFGKQGITSRATKRRKNKVINIGYIAKNIDIIQKKFGNKEGVIDLSDYKILGEGELNKAVKIKARAISNSAREKIERVGGEIKLPIIKESKKELNIEEK